MQFMYPQPLDEMEMGQQWYGNGLVWDRDGMG